MNSKANTQIDAIIAAKGNANLNLFTVTNAQGSQVVSNASTANKGVGRGNAVSNLCQHGVRSNQ